MHDQIAHYSKAGPLSPGKVFSIFFVPVFLLFSLPAAAQTGETELYAALDELDREMEAELKKLKHELSKVDLKALELSQRDWLQLRHSNCAFVSREESGGGVISNKMKLGCEIEATSERIAWLKAQIEDL